MSTLLSKLSFSDRFVTTRIIMDIHLYNIYCRQVIEQSLAAGEDSYKSYYWVHRAAESDNWYILFIQLLPSYFIFKSFCYIFYNNIKV